MVVFFVVLPYWFSFSTHFTSQNWHLMNLLLKGLENWYVHDNLIILAKPVRILIFQFVVICAICQTMGIRATVDHPNHGAKTFIRMTGGLIESMWSVRKNWH